MSEFEIEENQKLGHNTEVICLNKICSFGFQKSFKVSKLRIDYIFLVDLVIK